MNFINKIKIKTNNLRHNFRVVSKQNVNIEIYKILIKEIKEINKKYKLGNSTWDNNRKEVRRAILEDDISDFLNWNVIKNTMFYESGQLQYEELKSNKRLFQSIKESKVGNPKPYWLDSSTSGNAINHAYSMVKLLQKCNLTDFNNIVELGGGYGSMCRLFRKIGFIKKYTIFDLPEFSALQKYYLNSVGVFSENTVLTEDIEKLGDDNLTTLLIATWSLSEMPMELRERLSGIKFDYCLIGFQSEFDGVNNMEYFENFKNIYTNVNFHIIPAQNIKNNFYLIGIKNK